MKRDLLLPFAAFALVALLFSDHSSGSPNPDRKKIDVSKIHGRIQYVTSFPDYKVQAVQSFPDLKVQVVESFSDQPGKWQIVDSFPDFKIQMVEAFPDFKVQFVTSFPGPTASRQQGSPRAGF
ncbi:MAG TPA: hypothetical protein PLS03_10830 [Terrimicrobiaceae bacterium]|nr:hypothetical protein [Terrimicrobiaceae bacterium]